MHASVVTPITRGTLRRTAIWSVNSAAIDTNWLRLSLESRRACRARSRLRRLGKGQGSAPRSLNGIAVCFSLHVAYEVAFQSDVSIVSAILAISILLGTVP